MNILNVYVLIRIDLGMFSIYIHIHIRMKFFNPFNAMYINMWTVAPGV